MATSAPEIYTLSLHDALPISGRRHLGLDDHHHPHLERVAAGRTELDPRSEEHTSELQSHVKLVCRLLLEKKKKSVRNYKACCLPTTRHYVTMTVYVHRLSSLR